MSTHKIDKRFGTVAIQKGFIAVEQLLEVLKIQLAEELEGGYSRVTGEILLEKGYISTNQIDEVLMSMCSL